MVKTKILIFYILFLIFVNTFIGLFALSEQGKEFNIKDKMPITTLKTALKENLAQADEDRNFLSYIFNFTGNVLLIPFLILDYIILLLNLISITFGYIPVYVNILFYTPLTIFVMFDYIIPTIRGN